MKKLFAFLAVIGILSFGASNFVMAQEEAVIEEAVEGVVDTLEVSEEAVVPVPVVDEPVSDAPTPLHHGFTQSKKRSQPNRRRTQWVLTLRWK